jgi:hypothetical protein
VGEILTKQKLNADTLVTGHYVRRS